MIAWDDYESCMEAAAREGRPVLMIFYADWCPTCHAYKKIFYDRRVVEAAAQAYLRINPYCAFPQRWR